MKKNYNLTEENSAPNQSNRVHEPAIKYGIEQETEMDFSPPLTEEELANAITGEELLERVIPRIKKFFK